MRITKTKRNQLRFNDIVAFYGENENADVLYFGRIVQFDQLAALIVRLDNNLKEITSRGKYTQFWVNFWDLVAVDLDSLEQPIEELDEAATVGYFNI